MRLSLICDQLEKIAPASLADEWDNIGLLVGNPDVDVNRVAVALEATEATVDSALAKQAGLLVVHHPPLFNPLKKIDLSSPPGSVVAQAIRGGLGIFAAHTNFDAVSGGLNDELASRLGLATTRPALPALGQSTYKIVTFVPDSHLEPVSRALFKAGAGVIGNYSNCSFRSLGQGTYLPGKGTRPVAGKAGRPSLEPEVRLEVLVPEGALSGAVKAMIQAHPYEEVAYDVYPRQAGDSPHGAGRIGALERPERLSALADRVKAALRLASVRLIGPRGAQIENVALCTGSGGFLISALPRPQGCCLITGDIKYHEARTAQERGLAVIDAGHFGTEAIFVGLMRQKLAARLRRTTGKPISVVSVTGEKDPFVNV